MVHGTVIACGAELPTLYGVDENQITRVGHRPGKADVDHILAGAAHEAAGTAQAGVGADVIVVGTDADLAAVVLRLLRTDRLAVRSVGYVPAERASAVAAVWRLPTDPQRAMEVAVRGEVDRVPLIRDDVGGVLLGSGVLDTVQGVGYCDDTKVLRGAARKVHVEPGSTASAGLVVHVTSGGLLRRRTSTFTGRAFQLGCRATVPLIDGVAHPREITRWTWYRHIEDLRLVRGVV